MRLGTLVALGLAMTLMCGCQGKEAARPREAARSQSPTVPDPLTIPARDVTRALKAVELPQRFQITTRCLNPRVECDLEIDEAEQTQGISADGPEDPSRKGESEVLAFGVVTWATEKGATKGTRDLRRDWQRYVGRFNIPIKRKSRTYAPGERGRGSLTKLTDQGWTGFVVRAVMTTSYLGEPDSKPLAKEFVVLRRERYVITMVSWRSQSHPSPWPAVRRGLSPILAGS